MTWRSIIISKPARLSILNKQVKIEQKEVITVPLEDIAIIVIESPEVLFTQPFLVSLADYGITLLTCNDSHLPNGQWLSLLPHSRQTKIVRYQIMMSEPLKKRLWQRVIVSKITNQAQHLDYLSQISDAYHLKQLAETVKSGDPDNYESQAAMRYFSTIFGKTFSRRYSITVNNLLNYGYAIIRGAVARSLVSYGFLPVFGIHHDNEQNAFNLADDLIEPWRPWVDMAITQWFAEDMNNINQNASLKDSGTRRALTVEDKQRLVSLLHHQAIICSEKTTLLTAINRMVASFQTATLKKQPQLLQLPELCPLIWHQYE